MATVRSPPTVAGIKAGKSVMAHADSQACIVKGRANRIARAGMWAPAIMELTLSALTGGSSLITSLYRLELAGIGATRF
eukprot:scaffold10357_cov66-Attheya_sp.AAC.4